MSPDIEPSIRDRLSSWRQVSPQKYPEHMEKGSLTERELRVRQQRIASLCLQAVMAHDLFFADLKAYVARGGRDSEHQRRLEDFGAFALGVYEQGTGLLLQRGVHQVLDNLPREVVHTVYVERQVQKSWFKRLLGD